MKHRRIALVAVFAFLGALALAPTARAEEEEGAGDDLKERIKKKMERILELMEKNEAALLELSSGGTAKTRKVDIPVPEIPVPEGEQGGAKSGGAGESGRKAAEELAELARAQRKGGEQIPDELKQLVEMIPL